MFSHFKYWPNAKFKYAIHLYSELLKHLNANDKCGKTFAVILTHKTVLLK